MRKQRTNYARSRVQPFQTRTKPPRFAFESYWILNSTRGDDRFEDYDNIESKLFALCREQGMQTLVEKWEGEDVPSRAFSEGGIHEAIMDYEDTVFYEILAEELARRDLDYQPVSKENYDELVARMDDYIAEFEAHGTDNILISTMDEP